ncbi:hypothetical protein pEaSNUABM54_00269 [Erwinia phage pEa_SNUABM_54]|nr:hypothetical protein pEaSNUABM54_00269 [Erwinia phage pEa_SNUABM_54]
MYSLFETPRTNGTPRYHYQAFEAVRRRWDENISRLKGHWFASGEAVDSAHILSRLVGSFSIPLYDDVRKYFNAITDFVPNLCLGAGIIAPTNQKPTQGERGWFYGLDGQEWLVSVDFDIDPEKALKDWRNIEALKVIRHTLTDLDMALPDGKQSNVPDGYVVIAIDIPLLAVQYYGWVKSQLNIETGNRERNQQFIAQYVLPNLLVSQTTLAWFNRILNTWNGTPVAREGKQTPIAIATNYTSVDRVVGQIVDSIKLNRFEYKELMDLIPTATKSSMLAFVQLPYTVVHRQNQWVLEVAYVPYASLALSASAKFDNVQNQQERNHVWRLIQRIKNDRLFDAAPQPVRKSLLLDFETQVAAYVQK